MNKGLIKNIASLTFPAIIINITTPLLAISDVAIAGHSGNALYIAAIAVGSTLFNMLYWLLGFLRMGTTGLTAQAYGADNVAETVLIPARALAIALVTGLLFIAFQKPLGTLLLDFMDADAPTRTLASNYFRICIWGAPAVLGTFVLTGWFVGMQDTKVPMWISVFIDIFNIALSVTLVFGLKTGIAGIATGTLCAQWAGFIMALTICVRRNRHNLKSLGRKNILHTGNIRKLFGINADIFLRTLCLVAVTMWFTRTGARQGADMLAVNALIMQLFTLFSFFTDGIGFAAEALCGKCLGAHDRDGINTTVRTIMVIACGAALVFSGIYLLFGNDFLRLLSDDAGINVLAEEYFLWAVLIPLAGVGAFVWDGVCIGLTHTRSMLLSMIVAMITFFVCYAITFPTMHNHGLWLAFTLYLLIRGIVLTVIWRRYLTRTS